MKTDRVDCVRFRILVPIWGERYIQDFCTISLPALLAEGNLPVLINYAPCEVIFLTTRSSREIFDNTDGIKKIKNYCSYSFVFIDDLLPLESYGIILTAAYGRGIASLGELQTSTYFIFLNADFVLSNGILRTVVGRIKQGYNAVMSPSLRSKQEAVVVDLQKSVSLITGTLESSPRDLVKLTIKNLHITASSSVVNQNISYHNAANQFFWRVDDNTLVARFFLLFMLCIRPEIRFETCVGWCDYAFVPELVPSGNYDVITDSDDGFILEMQARRGEVHYIRSGRITPKQFAPRLSFWTTAHHRAYATHSIVFHAGALPPNLHEIVKEADHFMAELFSYLKQPPTSHLRHPYWTSGLLHFQDNIPSEATPPELPRYVPKRLEALRHRRGLPRKSTKLEKIVVRALAGVPPNVRHLHLAYRDYENFSKNVGLLIRQCENIIYVREEPGRLDAYLRQEAACTIITMAEIDRRKSDKSPFDGAIITVNDNTFDKIPRLLRHVAAHCADGAPMLICVDAIDSVFIWGRHTIYGDVIDLMGENIFPNVVPEKYTLITANGRLLLSSLLNTAGALVQRGQISTWLAASIIAIPAYLQLLLANLSRGRRASSDIGICTSATIWLRGPWRSTTATLAERAMHFDPIFYNWINTDVALAGIDPETHFREYGWKEMRDPSAHFSTSGYLSANPDVAAAQIDPLMHFRDRGLSEGRNGWQK